MKLAGTIGGFCLGFYAKGCSLFAFFLVISLAVLVVGGIAIGLIPVYMLPFNSGTTTTTKTTSSVLSKLEPGKS